MVAFTHGLLLIYDVHTTLAQVPVFDFVALRDDPDRYAAVDLTRVASRLGWMGSSNLVQLLEPTQLLFNEVPPGIFFRSEADDTFIFRQAFVRLSAAQIEHLAGRASNVQSEIEAFAGVLMPADENHRVAPRADVSSYCILLELSREIPADADYAQLARDARVALHTDRTVLVPITVGGVLVLPGPVIGGLTQSLTIISSLIQQTPTPVQVSDITYDFIELLVSAAKADYLASRFKYLPLAQSSPSAYVARRSAKSANSFAMYSAHLSDREELLDTVLTSDDQVAALRADVEKLRLVRLLRLGKVKAYPEVVAEQNPSPFAYDPLTSAVEKFELRIKKYLAAKAGAEARDRLIAEYLRDKVNADISRSNLAIQRGLSWLTKVAVVLAAIALIEGILPDSVRGAIGGWVQALIKTWGH